MSPAPGSCIVCGGASGSRLRRGGIEWARCGGCGLEWRDPLPDEAELSALYAGGYLERWGARDADAFARVRAMKQASHRELFCEIRRHREAGRLLDVGCAAGFLLEVAREEGYDPYGLEVDPEGARLARERFGARVHCGPLDAAAFPGERFDVVTLVDVLEHVRDPGALLDAVRARLAERGVFVAVLPNAASLVRRVLGARWPHYVAEHLFQWSPGNLERFLAARGLELRALRTGVRKTFTGRYLSAYAACVGSWLPPGVAWLGDLSLRIPTGEMWVVAGSARG